MKIMIKLSRKKDEIFASKKLIHFFLPASEPAVEFSPTWLEQKLSYFRSVSHPISPLPSVFSLGDSERESEREAFINKLSRRAQSTYEEQKI